MISEFLKSRIACPMCKGELRDSDSLECGTCRSTYRVEMGVPILLRKELSDPTIDTPDEYIQRKRYEAQHFSSIPGEYIDSVKIAWDDEAPFNHKIRRLLDEVLLDQAANSSVLDIGGAARGHVKKCGLADSSVVMDISIPWLVSLVTRGELAHAAAGDCEDLPFRSESFEVILVNGVLHHVPRQRLALQEIGRVLQPGGTAVIVEPAKWSVALVYYLLKRIVFLFSGAKGLQRHLHYYGSPYESYVAPKTVKSVFDSANYEVKIQKSTPLRLPYVGSGGGSGFALSISEY